jgi:ferredoxin--NADP+ reductase
MSGGKFAATRRPPPTPAAEATAERITAVRRWHETLLSIRTTRDRAFQFEPGQWVRLGLASGTGGIVWRSFSMASATTDEQLEFLAVVIPSGTFTTRLAAANPGDAIWVGRRPSGTLTASRFSDGRDLWMLASGTGLAPFLAMLRDAPAWSRFENIVLVHSVREARDLAYREEIAVLERTNLSAPRQAKLHFVPVVTREAVPGLLGRRLTQLIADGELERSIGVALDSERSRILLCGNPAMLDDVRDVLSNRGLRPDLGRLPGHFAAENYW